MKIWKILIIGLIGGILLSLVSALFPNNSYIGAGVYGHPLGWIGFYFSDMPVLGPTPNHPLRADYSSLLADIGFWFVVMIIILAMINYLREKKR
jgi:hypothetical protein